MHKRNLNNHTLFSFAFCTPWYSKDWWWFLLFTLSSSVSPKDFFTFMFLLLGGRPWVKIPWIMWTISGLNISVDCWLRINTWPTLDLHFTWIPVHLRMHGQFYVCKSCMFAFFSSTYKIFYMWIAFHQCKLQFSQNVRMLPMKDVYFTFASSIHVQCTWHKKW